MWNKFKIRLRACFRIMFRKYDHWVILNVSRNDLELLVRDKNFDVEVLYHGIQPYILYKIIQEVENGTDGIDMILEKAEFEHKADEKN